MATVEKDTKFNQKLVQNVDINKKSFTRQKLDVTYTKGSLLDTLILPRIAHYVKYDRLRNFVKHQKVKDSDYEWVIATESSSIERLQLVSKIRDRNECFFLFLVFLENMYQTVPTYDGAGALRSLC